jgi:hypothetical protein
MLVWKKKSTDKESAEIGVRKCVSVCVRARAKGTENKLDDSTRKTEAGEKKPFRSLLSSIARIKRATISCIPLNRLTHSGNLNASLF